MTNKFKVGDKVRFVEKFGSYQIGDKVKVTHTDHLFGNEYTHFIGEHGNGNCYSSRLELIQAKPTKNQRITKLEEEVAELKLIVAQIRKPSTIVEEALANDVIEFEGKQYKKVDREAREGDVIISTVEDTSMVRVGKPYKVGDFQNIEGERDCSPFVYNAGRTPENVDVYELMDGYNPGIVMVDEMPKPTANQLRAEIIEKAKGFVEDILGKYDTFNTTIGKYKDQCVRPVFQVNEKKRAITVLIYGAFSKELVFKGITKCHPKSVFNVWIGKAIALGRALGLDVSEFEQAVQPDEIVVGMKIKGSYSDLYNVTYVTNDKIGTDKGKAGFFHKYRLGQGELTIINDTNAKYEVNK